MLEIIYRGKNMKGILYSIMGIVIWSSLAVNVYAGHPIIIDSVHYSQVFGEVRNYRIFLPPDYYDSTQKRYPVIYFYHGWSQRYFGSIKIHESDTGKSYGGDNIGNFVATHEVIVVKPDGYNRSPGEKYYLRPYNVSPVETYRQFPLYFPEFVNFIDNNYRTLSDRNHRAIAGFSMGGFMAFWIGGKYPQMVSAVGSFCGSPEFTVGPKDFPVEYRHIDMYKNYGGEIIRLNYGNKDFIRGYHQDMNKIWPQVISNYKYRIYDSDHSICGLSDMFLDFLKTFEHPLQKPLSWNHIDVYPDFKVWGYRVCSDRDIPGFTVLENVDKRGLRCSVKEFMPDGSLMPFVDMVILTPPIYEKDQDYILIDVDLMRGEKTQNVIRSDTAGRIKIHLNGSLHEVGINRKEDIPNISFVSFRIDRDNWVSPKKKTDIYLRLLNKGTDDAKGVSAKLFSIGGKVRIIKKYSKFGDLPVGDVKESQNPYRFVIDADSVEIAGFKLVVTDRKQHEWSEYFEIPVRDAKEDFNDFIIADGKELTVAEAGDDTVSMFLGAGNGDGVANPGESIVILIKDGKGLYRRTFLYTSDHYVNPYGINIRKSDNWTRYDHVGGSEKYSVPLIASDCPPDHVVTFFAEYWLPDYPYHIIKRGIVKVDVKGKDHTPPQIKWAKVSGDNTVQVSVYDGAPVHTVKVKLVSLDDPGDHLEVGLADNGKEGDRVAKDNVFGKKIYPRKFGLYHMEISATDIYGNSIMEKYPGIFMLH